MGYVDVSRFLPVSTGTGDFVVASAVQGYQTPASAAALDQQLYFYRAELSDLTQWEVGSGLYTSATTTLARTTVYFNSLGTTAKINFSSKPQVALVALAEGLREKLISARTYYVRKDGSDSNGGLVDTAAGAFLTIQKAINTVSYSIDPGSFGVEVIVRAGTYSEDLSISTTKYPSFQLTGDTTTPSNVVIAGSSIALTVISSNVSIRGFKITATSAHGIFSQFQSLVNVNGNMEFGVCGFAHMVATRDSTVEISANYSASGATNYHWYADECGMMNVGTVTVTLTGTPAFATFAVALRSSLLFLTGITFSGTATGQRYNANTNSVIETGSASATYLPGNSAGTVTTGGQYE